jgi:hypothetical protein
VVKFESVKGLSDEEFRRLTGVKGEICEAMMAVLRKAETVKKFQGEAAVPPSEAWRIGD